MTVHIVTLAIDKGKIVAVFSDRKKAANYVAEHPYNSYTITEVAVDEHIT